MAHSQMGLRETVMSGTTPMSARNGSGSLGGLRYHLARRGAAALCGMAVVACGAASVTGPTSNESATASGMTFSELAAGALGSAPTGKNYVRIVKFVQAPNQSIASKKHQAGIIYVQTGLQELTYTDSGTQVQIPAGTGLFLQDVNHSHETLPGALSTWYFIALWPDTPQSSTLVAPSTLAFKTEDLPPTAMPPGQYTETLRSVTLQPGGRSPAHVFGGLEVVFVLDGTLKVDVAGQGPVQLPAGQATYVPAHTLTQELAVGAQKVDYLAYFITEHGTAFETDATSTPPG
jgi:mannose-6-phosphate isomerase-like protein (cupin superfamily)